MTQTCSFPHRPHLRDHAERLIAAFEAAPAPQTHADILRAARTLMALDRMVTQLWSEPGQKASRRGGKAPEATSAPETAVEKITADPATPPDRPPNRQERRAQAARDRTIRPASAALPHRDTG